MRLGRLWRAVVLVAALSALVFGVAACGGDDDPTVAGSTSSTSTSSTSVADTEDALAEAGLVWLESTGLSLLDAEGSVTGRVEFGEARRVQLVEAMDTHLGVDGVAADLDSCGEGTMKGVRYPGISLYFQKELFAGWFVDDSEESLVFRTSDDIGIGSTKTDLDEAFGGEISIEETSLGFEWMSSTGFQGTLTEHSQEGTVDHLWAGQTCIAR